MTSNVTSCLKLIFLFQLCLVRRGLFGMMTYTLFVKNDKFTHNQKYHSPSQEECDGWLKQHTYGEMKRAHGEYALNLRSRCQVINP